MPGILARYRRRVPRRMEDEEWRAFVSEGTRTGKLATTRHDGRPHVVPIWFVLDGDDFVFNTGEHTIKGRALARTGLAALCVDDDRPPFAFVSVTGTVTITRDSADLLRWATAIGARYMGADRAEEFGERNAVDGELLVRLHADHVFAQVDIAG
jgi:PPOX class probable F420-dependent enzyme